MTSDIKMARQFTTVLAIFGFVTCGFIIFYVTTPGEFTEWSKWTQCSLTCGKGVEKRSRSCTNPPPGILGSDCEGPRTETRHCFKKPCPLDGGYTEWGKFGDCDKKCGGGTRIRRRFCSNPGPAYGGKTCEHLGVSEEKQACNIQPCPINGGYSEWGKFTGCSIAVGEVCGKGKKVRVRTCNNPVPQHGGKACEGPDKEEVECEILCTTTKPSNATKPTQKSVATNSTKKPT